MLAEGASSTARGNAAAASIQRNYARSPPSLCTWRVRYLARRPAEKRFRFIKTENRETRDTGEKRSPLGSLPSPLGFFHSRFSASRLSRFSRANFSDEMLWVVVFLTIRRSENVTCEDTSCISRVICFFCL